MNPALFQPHQLAWLEVMKRESRKSPNPLNFRGIALTGWSRYDHFAVLCELLPAALPSLILSLVRSTEARGQLITRYCNMDSAIASIIGLAELMAFIQTSCSSAFIEITRSWMNSS